MERLPTVDFDDNQEMIAVRYDLAIPDLDAITSRTDFPFFSTSSAPIGQQTANRTVPMPSGFSLEVGGHLNLPNSCLILPMFMLSAFCRSAG